MGLQEIGRGAWTDLAPDSEKWKALVTAVVNLDFL